jgi:magnesium-transporting ATPase (P-type)
VLRFLAHFHNVLIYVLLASAAVTAALQHWIDTGVILAVVIVNAVIGYIQEGRAEQAMAAIRGMLAPHSAVLRDGKRISVDAADLVPGDIVLVEAGDRVPADLRLIEARGLKAEEAILTGRVRPCRQGHPAGGRRRRSRRPDADAVLRHAGRRRHRARARHRHRGGHPDRPDQRHAVGGRDADHAAGRADGPVRPLADGLHPDRRRGAARLRLFRRPHAVSELFMAVVGLSVAAIPEGLPAVLTITLAVGVQAMARRNAIVRRLPAIETLGSVSVICSDKTGTLTRNEMMVASLAAAEHVYSVSGNGYAPEGAVRWREADAHPDEHAVLMEFARTAALCNDSVLHARGTDWHVEGDPMEGALLALAGKITGDGAGAVPELVPRRRDPLRRGASLHGRAAPRRRGRARIHVKGAPEAVLALCRDQRAADGGTEPLDPATGTRWSTPSPPKASG